MVDTGTGADARVGASVGVLAMVQKLARVVAAIVVMLCAMAVLVFLSQRLLCAGWWSSRVSNFPANCSGLL
jgi:hypothetical protein